MEWVFPYISYQAAWQTKILLFFQSLRTDPFNVIFYLITNAGDETFYIALICIVFWCINKRVGYFAGFSLVSATVLNAGLKNLFMVPRPLGHNGIEAVQHPVKVVPSGYSFPSGHSMGAGSFWFAMITGFKKRWLTILGVSVMILVPVSRLYFGVHTPVDVTTGLILGILTALIIGKLLSIAETGSRLILFLPIVPFAVWGFWVHDAEYWKTLGTLIGLTAGYVIETGYIKFEMTKGASKIAARIILGIAVLVLIKSGLKLILPASIVSDTLRYLCIGLWVAAGAPALFKKASI